MGWARFDDQFPLHPKTAALRDLMLPCIGLHVLAICYANAYLTDGFVPASAIPRLAGDLAHLLPEGHAWGLVDRLVEAGMWEKVKDGYTIHDFLDYNPSKRDVMKLRQTRALAGHSGGLARAKQRAKLTLSNETATATAKRKQKRAPSPSPSPSPELTPPLCPPLSGPNGHEPSAEPPVPWKLADPISAALTKTRFGSLGADQKWWQAQFRANQGVDFANQLLKAEAWLVSNPQRVVKRPRTFLNGWFGRSERV